VSNLTQLTTFPERRILFLVMHHVRDAQSGGNTTAGTWHGRSLEPR
jgi:hypothetical protein